MSTNGTPLLEVRSLQVQFFTRGGTAHADQVDDATRQIDASIAALAKSVSKPTFGDLLDAVAAAWSGLQALAAPALAAGGLAALDAAAEQLLAQADKLTLARALVAEIAQRLAH